MKRLSKKLGVFCGMFLCGMLLFATCDMTVCAGEEVAVQALPLGGLKEPVGLQAAGAVGVAQVGCI